MFAKYPRKPKCIIEELEPKDDNTWNNALCLARGIKQQRLLGGNPMNKINFSVIVCFHFYATVMIEFSWF
jgi:hypothetical protein